MRHWFYHYHSRQSIQIRANFVVLCDVRDTWKLNCMLLSTGKIMTVPCVRQRPETAGGSSAVPQQPLRSPRQQPALHFEHVSADPSWFLSQDDLKFNPGVVFCYAREKWLWRGKQSTVWHRAIFLKINFLLACVVSWLLSWFADLHKCAISWQHHQDISHWAAYQASRTHTHTHTHTSPSCSTDVGCRVGLGDLPPEWWFPWCGHPWNAGMIFHGSWFFRYHVTQSEFGLLWQPNIKHMLMSQPACVTELQATLAIMASKYLLIHTLMICGDPQSARRNLGAAAGK